jgi:type III secretion protein U
VSQDDSADKTEKPTPKRLREARQRGDVPKSKDLSSTVGTLVWLLIVAAMLPVMQGQLGGLLDHVFDAVHTRGSIVAVVVPVAVDAIRVLIVVGVVPALLAGLIGTLVEFLQVRGVLTFDKVTPDLKHLNPVEGVKKMFSAENLIEIAKSILKAVLIVGLMVVLVRLYANDLFLLSTSEPGRVGSLWWRMSLVFVIWTLVFFLFLSLGDTLLQHFNYIKKLRMSRRDIKQEYREDEGDPYIKQRRKQLHHEWAQQNMKAGVRRANVVVTNPTHLAVALYYEKGETVVPMVTAKGEDEMARVIRETAEEEGIPVMRHVDLARSLYAEVEMEDYVPRELFEAVAQVLIWAREVRSITDADGDRPLPPPPVLSVPVLPSSSPLPSVSQGGDG